MLKTALLIMALFLAACANQPGQPLPMVSPDAPVWPLVPDHLDYGSLPL